LKLYFILIFQATIIIIHLFCIDSTFSIKLRFDSECDTADATEMSNVNYNTRLGYRYVRFSFCYKYKLN